MLTKIIMTVLVATVFLLLFVVTGARILDDIMPKFSRDIIKNDENLKKVVVIVEIIIQLTIVILYIFLIRLILTQFLKYLIPGFTLKNIKSIESYTLIIVAPIAFLVQPNLIKKIKHIYLFLPFKDTSKSLDKHHKKKIHLGKQVNSPCVKHF